MTTCVLRCFWSILWSLEQPLHHKSIIKLHLAIHFWHREILRSGIVFLHDNTQLPTQSKQFKNSDLRFLVIPLIIVISCPVTFLPISQVLAYDSRNLRVANLITKLVEIPRWQNFMWFVWKSLFQESKMVTT